MGNRGFTTIELFFSLAFGIVFIYVSIFVPTELVRDYKEFQKNLDNTLSILSMSKSILYDAPLSDGKIHIDGNDVMIGNSRYLFLTDGVHRVKRNNLKLTKNSFVYDLDENIFKITGGGMNKHKQTINLRYNAQFSSFPYEEGAYD